MYVIILSLSSSRRHTLELSTYSTLCCVGCFKVNAQLPTVTLRYDCPQDRGQRHVTQQYCVVIVKPVQKSSVRLKSASGDPALLIHAFVLKVNRFFLLPVVCAPAFISQTPPLPILANFNYRTF